MGPDAVVTRDPAESKSLLDAELGRSVYEHLKDNGAVMERCFASEDHKEGVASSLERRAPKYRP